MNRNSWLDKWMSLPRGQRRATIILLCIIVILCALQIYIHVDQRSAKPSSSDYSALQQEIELFRSQLDSIPVSARRKPYVRHTKVVHDTVKNSLRPSTVKPPVLEPVPRIKRD